MASTSSSSASAPTHYEYEVFLSFRGVDTRNSFTDHLYKALCQAGIRTFRDADEIHEGQELKPEIERSIIESRASIIVFSENFSNSSWCLDELLLILQQQRSNHFILPVYYKVDPSDVRNQRGSFMIEAKEGVKGTKWTQSNVKRWKAALTEVAYLKGIVVSGPETAFIADIVDKVYCELDLKLLSTPTDLTGIEARAKAAWLKYEQPGTPILAICGMGGAGKTTLAKYLYNSNKQNFECSSFLEGIENQPSVLLGLQKQLINDVSVDNNITISNVSEGTSHIEKVLQRKKALIVVDDIDDPEQLNTLLGRKVFHTQSKIIITTRHLNVDTWYGSISRGCHVHKIELLNDHESWELLSFHAFGSKVPMEGFEDLASQLAQYCGGNPLALKVLGSSLPVRVEEQRTRKNMIESWRSRMDSLNSLKGDINSNIQGVLHKSFESLPCHSHKELFLHIACLFVGEFASRVEKILEKDWHAKSGMLILVNRCLLTYSKSRDGLKVEMHKLLQNMARKIVSEESKYPAERTRVWNHEESYFLLRKGVGSKTVESLVLDMREAEQSIRSKAFKTSALVKMKNLKFLRLDYVQLTGSYKNFPDLILLHWWDCNLRTIPQGLFMSSLVALHMCSGELEKFEPPKVLSSLKILDLSYSYKLISIRNLHRFPKLESLNLLSCTSLTHVCKTIGDLENLSFLKLGRCTELWKASSNKKFVKKREDLKALFNCRGIPKQPLFSIPQSLLILNLTRNVFEILPSHIDLNMLKRLILTCCPNLKSLPCLPSTLEDLYVDWCTSLKKITFQSARFRLREFGYEGCFKLCEIEGLFKLVSISKLDETDLGHMQWIKAYQHHKVDLVGDVITKGRTFNIQMLYEYGIRSAYLQDVKDQSMAAHEYTSSSSLLSFRVPLHLKKKKIKGLNTTIIYRSISGEGRDMWPPLFAKISNGTKDVTWVYSPVVCCKPTVDKDVTWLSYWPIGNTLDAGDEVHLSLIVENETIIATGCGASFVYMDDGEIEKQEEKRVDSMKGEFDVIGGDLSLFEVSKGSYYLCSHDFFRSDLLKLLFGDKVHHTDSRRWRAPSRPIFQQVDAFRNRSHKKIRVEVGVNFTSDSETGEIEKAVSRLVGVESVSTDKEIGRLYVCGRIDPQSVATCVRDFDKIVQVINCRTLMI